MWKRMLSILFPIALLIYPLSLFAQTSFSLSLDVDGSAGDQAVTSVNTSANRDVSVQVFGSAIQNATAFGLRFDYDASQVTYQGFDAGGVLPGTPQILPPEHGTNPTYVAIGIVSLGSQATASSGLIGTIRFRTTAAFSGTAIRLVRGQLSRGGQTETVTLNISVELQVSAAPSSDFDGDGMVGISDFLLFVNHFGLNRGDAGYDAKYDLDSNNGIGISDFLIFVNNFGSQGPTSGGGSGGSGGSGGGTPPSVRLIRLTQNYGDIEYLAYSPDGSQIAFVSERGDNDAIYVMNVDGSNPIRLTQNYDDVEYLAYSPDGSQMRFCF